MTFQAVAIPNQRYWRESDYSDLEAEVGRLAYRPAPPRVVAVCNRIRESIIRAWVNREADNPPYRNLAGEFWLSQTDLGQLKALELEMAASWLRELVKWCDSRRHPGAFWLEQISLHLLWHCRAKQRAADISRPWHSRLRRVDRRQDSTPWRNPLDLPARPVSCEEHQRH
jgi:hypothetical protein